MAYYFSRFLVVSQHLTYLVTSQADVLSSSKFATSASLPPQRRKIVEPAFSALCLICARSQQPRTDTSTTWHSLDMTAVCLQRCKYVGLYLPIPQPGAEAFQGTRNRMEASTPNCSSCKLVTQTSNTTGSSICFGMPATGNTA